MIACQGVLLWQRKRCRLSGCWVLNWDCSRSSNIVDSYLVEHIWQHKWPKESSKSYMRSKVEDKAELTTDSNDIGVAQRWGNVKEWQENIEIHYHVGQFMRSGGILYSYILRIHEELVVSRIFFRIPDTLNSGQGTSVYQVPPLPIYDSNLITANFPRKCCNDT